MADASCTVAEITTTNIYKSGNPIGSSPPGFSRSFEWMPDVYNSQPDSSAAFEMDAQVHLSAITATVTPNDVPARGSSEISEAAGLGGMGDQYIYADQSVRSGTAYEHFDAFTPLLTLTAAANSYRAPQTLTWDGTIGASAASQISIYTVGATATASAATATIGSPFIFKVP